MNSISKRYKRYGKYDVIRYSNIVVDWYALHGRYSRGGGGALLSGVNRKVRDHRYFRRTDIFWREGVTLGIIRYYKSQCRFDPVWDDFLNSFLTNAIVTLFARNVGLLKWRARKSSIQQTHRFGCRESEFCLQQASKMTNTVGLAEVPLYIQNISYKLGSSGLTNLFHTMITDC